MKTVNVSTFKARCLSLLAEVQRTGEPILVTRRGKPLARVGPPENTSTGLGCMRGTARIVGEIVEFDGADEWEALQ